MLSQHCVATTEIVAVWAQCQSRFVQHAKQSHNRRMRSLAALVCAVVTFAWGNGESTNAICSSPHCLVLPIVSVAPPLQLTQCATFRDRGAIWHLQGYVLNTSSKTIYNASVSLYGKTEAGALVTSTVPLALPATFPGQLNPYEALFAAHPGYPLNPKVEIVTYTTVSTTTVEPLTVVTSRTIGTGNVEATFRNDTSSAIHQAQAVIGKMYIGSTCLGFAPPDPDGFSYVYPPYAITPVVRPGETVTYTFPVGAFTQSWVIFAQGIVSP